MKGLEECCCVCLSIIVLGGVISMSDKVIGARISESMYNELQKLNLSNSELIETALKHLLEYYKDTTLTTVNTNVDKVIFENKYRRLTKVIDRHLSKYETLFLEDDKE